LNLVVNRGFLPVSEASFPLQSLAETASVIPAGEEAALVDNGGITPDIFSDEQNGAVGFVLEDSASILSPGSLSGNTVSPGSYFTYKVKAGDNLSRIAANFGISVDTIRLANPETKNRLLKVGAELVILPVSGIRYEVTEGDTIDSIATAFSIEREKLIEFNQGINVIHVPVGTTIVIPGVTSGKSSGMKSDPKLPNLSGYFKLPIVGYNWGQLHGDNAVDIANACGTPISASAAGLVTEALSPNDWNGGYGGKIKIEHDNGTATMYGHLQKLLVAEGDLVTQGQEIALMGSTGKVSGYTGCHLHIAVLGAQNPWMKH